MKYILLLTALLATTTFAAPDFDETMAAAKQGDGYAQYNLGVMYDKGVGVPENNTEAVKWYRKAADQGLAMALPVPRGLKILHACLLISQHTFYDHL